MENEKKSNGTLVGVLIGLVIALLVVGGLFATGTIGFKTTTTNNNEQASDNNQTTSTETNQPETSNNNQTTSTETNQPETSNNNSNEKSSWVDYLLSRHLLDAKITRVRSKDLGDSVDLNKTVTIKMNDVKELLTNLKSNKLIKTWSQGRGGPDKDHLVIAYENNNERYDFEIYYGSIVIDKLDEEFKTILDNNKYEEKNAEYKNIQGSFYFYSIDGYSDTIFDKYFN